MPVASHLTFVPSGPAPAAGEFASWGGDADVVHHRFGLPGGSPTLLRTVTAEVGGALRPADVEALSLPLVPTVRALAALPPGGDWAPWERPSASILAWSVAAKFALELVAAGRLLPSVVSASAAPGVRPTRRGGTGAVIACWRASPPADGRLEALAEAFPVAAHALRTGADDRALVSAERLVSAFLDAVADACGRGGVRPVVDPRRRPHRAEWGRMWAQALTGTDPVIEHLRAPAAGIVEAVAGWAAPVLEQSAGPVRLAVRLEPPADDRSPGDRPTIGGPPHGGPASGWRLSLAVQSSTDPDAVVDARAVWEGDDLVLGGRRVTDAEDVLVRGLATAATLYTPLERALGESHPTHVELHAAEAAAFLDDGVDALETAGIGVLVPPELREATAKRLRLQVRIGQETPDGDRVDVRRLTLRELVRFRYEVALGDDVLDDDAFAQVAATGSPLVRWRGNWVRIDASDVDRFAELRGRSGTMAATEALAAALSGQHGAGDLGAVDAVATGAVEDLVDRLRRARDTRVGAARITGIVGELRPYQRDGVAWLQRLAELGFGGVLADEMGLGKTVQAIALLTSRPQDRPSLVVCPTSVVGNWERELRRWAPDLPPVRHHGPERAVHARAFTAGRVVVTTYALLRRDIGMLEDVRWDVVVFDEAQQIKNPSSKGARAARALDARTKVTMTGTPVENRLGELWAIVDVTNPGLLGSQRRFAQRFASPIERWHDRDAAAQLRRLVAPFLLRRTKDDPDVAVDLPPKHEITVACTLTREQAALYQSAVDQAFRGEGLGATTFERRGRILALLTALKQICNHPAHYLRDGGRLPGRSGKLARATEILQEVVASGDHALVFTQYREMGELLATHLRSELDVYEVPFLHGGVALGAREAMVARFQDDDDAPPVLLVSLRAGGTGLNLTRATEVVHFDRWWNPAVEQQATDRVHRIGQLRPVTVHTLVTAGTIEERIAELLERKRGLADQVVGVGESWITELGDDDLRELVALSREDVEDEDDVA